MSGSQTLHDPDKLRNARIDAGLNQVQLAERAGVHTSHISLLERGLRDTTPKTLGSIAKALGCRVKDLRRTKPAEETPASAASAA